jgi:hypothetical protein
MPDPHDLVVSRASAAANASRVIEVDCDHFSYLEHPVVQTFLTEYVFNSEDLTW